MCGRYYFKIPMSLEGEKMKCFIENYQLFAYEQGEIFPSMDVIAFIYQNDHYEPKVMEWGLSLGKKRVINARIETVLKKLYFKT